MQQSLIWELILYKSEPVHNTLEATKNNDCLKGEDIVDYDMVTR